MDPMATLRVFLGAITVEPVLFLYSLGGSFQWPTVDAMIYRKVCLEFYNQTVCDNLSTVEYTAEEDVVQAHTSYWYLANNLCFEVPSIITSLFYGNLSDHFSRKTALMLPLIGQMITLLVYLINSIFFSLPVGLILIGPLLSGLFGGWITCNIAAYSYLSEVSTAENRAIRIAIGESMAAFSISIGFFTSGVTLDHTSYPIVLSISLALYTIAFLYARFGVKDLNTIYTNSDTDPKITSVIPNSKCCNVMKTLCSKESIRESFAVIFKEREGRGRSYIIIMLFGMFSGILTGSASWLIGYLYLRRQPLSWSQTLYGYYVGVLAGVHALALVICVPILKKVARMTDTGILILATFLQALAEAFFAFCTSTWMVFMVPIVGLLSDARPTCNRALLSQLVEPKELGKIFAIVGSLQSLGTLVATFTYNSAYPATLNIWPGLCFMAGALFTFIPIGLFCWVHFHMKKSGQSYRRLQLDDILDDNIGDHERLIDCSKHESGDHITDLEEEISELLDEDVNDDITLIDPINGSVLNGSSMFEDTGPTLELR